MAKVEQITYHNAGVQIEEVYLGKEMVRKTINGVEVPISPTKMFDFSSIVVKETMSLSEAKEIFGDGIALFSQKHPQFYPWYNWRRYHYWFRRPKFSKEAIEKKPHWVMDHHPQWNGQGYSCRCGAVFEITGEVL